MTIDIALRLEILRPGSQYGPGNDAQTEEEYNALIEWRDPGTEKPTWEEVIALGDVELTEDKVQAIIAIDNAAGAARSRYVSSGPMVTDEYRLALAEAQAYAAAGYAGEVPLSIAAWVNGSAFTAQQAADNIIATEALLNGVLNSIRLIRLPAKKTVNDAANSTDVITARDGAIALLDAV